MTSEPVGSLAEEAAKLIAVVQGWAHAGAADDEHGDDEHGDDEHVGGAECRYCPVCALARQARALTPEVRDHLANAAVSLALAFKGLLDDVDTTAEAAGPVEKIDLAED